MRLPSLSTPVRENSLPLSAFEDSQISIDGDSTKHVPFHGLPNHSSTPLAGSSSPGSYSDSAFSESNQKTDFGPQGLRRALSGGNLEGLIAYNSEEFRNSTTQKRSLRKQYYTYTMLRSAPSFSIFNNTFDGVEDGKKNGQQDVQKEEPLARTVTIGDYIEDADNGDFTFGKKIDMGLIAEEGEDFEEGIYVTNQNLIFDEEMEPPSPPMYLATGLGIDVAAWFDGVGVVDLVPMNNFDEIGNMEEYYKRMVDEYPCHPLYLRNYAQLLQYKGDLRGAEDYFHRATLADPGDAETLMQYAKVVWELHHDHVRATTYFERAAQAAPHDCDILGAYANFLWEISKDEEDDGEQQDDNESQLFQIEIESSTSVHEKEVEPRGLRIDDPNSDNIEEYHKRMVEENPSNPVVLGKYAQFLSKCKGDFQGAEDYYSRAALADPANGEILSQYAKLVWDLHHDHDKALGYYEQAVEATPADCNVLAAYASFLWQTEENDSTKQEHFQAPLQGGAVVAANS
ncbi:uncharacterized protein LOC123210893 isoform X2 [Mangifera indica]|uniref:uncharacterized protein LOC123210893 isoform X2 n=1 Tax=Mangifera indica TaxID=29780 RepID=UPI001CF9C2DE|nr:uncharacterized protein LOC123210893 isoform X2 [Mangifera indica]